jgi:hypothetical protein
MLSKLHVHKTVSAVPEGIYSVSKESGAGYKKVFAMVTSGRVLKVEGQNSNARQNCIFVNLDQIEVPALARILR